MPKKTDRKFYDAIVIGGGCLGHAIALELAAAAVKTLLVYPVGHGGDSATLAAGAMIGAFGELVHTQKGPVERQKLEFRIQSQDLYRPWLERLQEATGVEIFTASGIFMIANRHGRQDRANLEHIQSQLDRYGRRNEWVAPKEVPGLSPTKTFPTLKALFIHDDLSVDSADLMRALGTAVENSPFCTVLHQRVASIVPRKGGLSWRVEAPAGEWLEAANVAVCAGARVASVLGDRLLPKLKLPTLSFLKGIGGVVTGAPSFPHAIRTTNRSDACGVHVVPRARNRLYLGASSHLGYATAAARGITPGEVIAILGDTSYEIHQELRDTTIEELRFGLRPACADDRPLIGRTRLPGLFLATGTLRTGIVMSPRIAQVVAAEILHPSHPSGNPFPADATRPAGPATGDLNLANLNADRGLGAYNEWRQHGAASARARAIEMWKRYLALAEKDGDARIRDMVDRMEAGESVADWIW